MQGLDQGEFTRFQAAEAFVNSPEGVRDAVQAAYQQFLHRATDPQGLSSSSSFLLGGGSLTALDVDLISSDEYFQVRGGTNAGFVNGLYQDALGRSAAGNPGRRHWSTLSALARAAGKRLPPSCRAWNTGRALIDADYQQFLGRATEPVGFSVWLPFLAANRPQDLEAGILSSDEYFAIQNHEALNTTGLQGATGQQGPQGVAGPQGTTGPQGANGSQGLQGPSGSQGPQGATGPQGVTGPEGPQGANGSAGSDGATGPQGPQGATGPQGPAGATGPQGARRYRCHGAARGVRPARVSGRDRPNRAAGTARHVGSTGRHRAAGDNGSARPGRSDRAAGRGPGPRGRRV